MLDLATMRETSLGETAGFDDQAEWLDDEHVLYGLDGDIRVVAADGSGAPATLSRGRGLARGRPLVRSPRKRAGSRPVDRP